MNIYIYIYKINFGENRRIYFLIKKEKFLLNKWKFYKKLWLSWKLNLTANLHIVKSI